MIRIVLVLTIGAVLCSPVGGIGAVAAQGAVRTATPAGVDEPRQVVQSYCVTCHNSRSSVGKDTGIVLDTLDVGDPGSRPEVWEKVVKKVRAGMMPPAGMPRPDASSQGRLLAFLEEQLDRSAAAHPNPGRGLLRRLNRAEYSNAIRDLLAVEVDASSFLPPDESGYGFDNVADVQTLSPILLERYLVAAGRISALAIGDVTQAPGAETFRVRQDASQDVHVEGLPIGTVGGLLVRTTLPLDATYEIQTRLYRTNLSVLRGLEYPRQLEITVDGVRVHLAAFGGDEDFKASLANSTLTADQVDGRLKVRLPLAAGPHTIGAAFVYKSAGRDTRRLRSFIRSSADTLDPTGHPHVETLTITGPFVPTGRGDTPSRRRIFECRPASAAREDVCAQQIISTLANRAYRGRTTAADRAALFAFYQIGRRKGSFDAGIELALRRILASPKFLFRAESAPPVLAAGTAYRVSDLDLAARLSFFLWSSIPDDELLRVAGAGRLSSPDGLRQQVARMLRDPKSQALVTNFAGQWLYLRNLKNQIPNSLGFPDFDDNLRQAMQRETEMFFESILREDRNVIDLMTADYTFVNERLARHYGIDGVYGSHFRRVPVPNEARRGLLGQGSVLTVTSHADRTSPVVRGKWILDNLLGAPPPPPPANVPPLEESSDGGRPRSMRERMEVHRTNPLCASCHRIMDPIGFALENFDAVGAWRTIEARVPIDASGQLMDGTRVDGAVSLRQALMRDPQLFVGTVTEKLMTYALGRGLGPGDMPVVRAIVRDASRQDYRFSSLIQGIVDSTPFRMRVKELPSNDGLSAAATGAPPPAQIATTQKRSSP